MTEPALFKFLLRPLCLSVDLGRHAAIHHPSPLTTVWRLTKILNTSESLEQFGFFDLFTCSSLPQLPRCCEFRILHHLPVVRLGECLCVGRGTWTEHENIQAILISRNFPSDPIGLFLTFQLLCAEVWWLHSRLIFCLFGLAVPVALCQACTAGALCL